MARPLEFGILGPLEVRSGGALVDVGRPKQRAVLAALLLQANRVVPVDVLVDQLWGDTPPARATGALQVYISGLRRSLEPGLATGGASTVLVTRAPGYQLRVRPDALDAARFEALAGQGHARLAAVRPAAAGRVLDQALALWRGPALAEFAFEPFAQAEAARLEELRAGAEEDRLEAALGLGDHVRVVGALEVAVGLRPLRERLWALLMLALYRSGRQGEALRAFGRARAVLVDELGIDPGPELRRLEADVLAQSPALEWEPADEEPRTVTVTIPVVEAPPPAPWRPGLVGREDARATLDRALDQCLAGRGAVVLVSGEAGIGKSRLVEELARRADGQGGASAVGRCHPGEGAPSFWPWVQVVRCLLADTGDKALRAALGPAAAEIAQIVPEVKDVVDEVEPPPPLDPAAARFRLYDAFAGFLGRLASGRALVVILDDLHWADLASLELLELVAGRAASTGLMVVGAFRDNDVTALSGPLARTLGTLARSPELHRVALAGLSRDEVARFIADTAGIEASPAVAATIHARTAGNPFFVAELTRLLASRDALSGGRADDDDASSAVPPGVRAVIRLRLAALPAPTTELLELASVAGRDIEVGLVAAAAALDGVEVLDRLDAATATGVVVEDPVVVGRLRFSHGLVQETIYRDLTAARRARLHARVAAGLRRLHGDVSGGAVELAHHLYQAAPVLGPEEPFAAAIRASRVAEAGLGYEQAEEQLRRAVELTGMMATGPPRWQHELDAQARLASLLTHTSGQHVPAVTDAWGRARDLCERLGSSAEVLVPLLWGHARATKARGQHDVADRIGAELLELARSAPAGTAGFAQVAGDEARGAAALYQGRFAAAVEHLSRVVATVDEPSRDGGTGALVHHPGALCGAYLALALALLGDDAGSDAQRDRSVQLARDSGHRFNEALVYVVVAHVGFSRDEPEVAERLARQVLERGDQTTFGPLATMAGGVRAWGRARQGQPDGAVAALRLALADLASTGWRMGRTYFLAMLADTLWCTGDIDGAVVAAEEGLAEGDATGERYCEAELCLLRGELAALTGPGGATDAETWLRRAAEVAEAQQAILLQRRVAASLARLGLGHNEGTTLT
ncbi:MAG: BTAD domain-containing putative transcriptional regulator [Acidimicrobiales bacterium]